MEKYGADYNEIPYTDEQFRTIKKMAKEEGVTMPCFKTFKQAQDIIDNGFEKRGI